MRASAVVGALEILNKPKMRCNTIENVYFHTFRLQIRVLFSERYNTEKRNVCNMFNSFHPRLKFTMEIGGNKLNFLDISMIKKDEFLIFN